MRLTDTLTTALLASDNTRDAAVNAAVTALATASPADVPTDPTARRALWIDAYNVLTLHSLRAHPGGTALATVWRCATSRYDVCGVPLTLDQIEHGLLRDDHPAPWRPWRPLGPRHPAAAWRVPLDPRIHFALNCGAASCPLIRTYVGMDVEVALDAAESSFLTAESTVDDAAGTVSTSQLLAFYLDDFGGNPGVLRRIARALGRPAEALAHHTLVFTPYDWSAATRFAHT